MTFEAATAKDRHEVGWILIFDGIEPFFSTHDFTEYGLLGTYIRCIVDGSLEGDGEELDEQRRIILPGDFAVRVFNSAEVRAVLRRKGGTRTKLVSSINASQTTITLTSTAMAGLTVYCDRETIVIGTHSGSGVYAGCTRAAHGSLGQHHRAASIVSTTPRHWLERRAALAQVYLDDSLDAGSRAGIHRVGFLTKSPEFENGAYSLTFTDFSTILSRPLLSGFKPITVSAENITAGEDTVAGLGAGEHEFITFTVPDIRQLALSGDDTGHIKIEAGGSSSIYRLRTPFAGDSVTVYHADRIAGDLDLSFAELATGEHEVTLHQVEVVYGRAGHQALQVLTSEYGDETNGDWDVLPGRPPSDVSTSSDVSAKRVGAGIPQSWVDIDAWLSIPGESFVTYIDETTTLADFLGDEILWRTGGHLYITADGKLSWRRDDPAAPRSLAQEITLEDDTIAAAVFSVDDEEGVIGRAVIECNYVPGIGYTKTQEVAFHDLADIYEQSMPQLELKSKSLWIGDAPSGQIVSPPTPYDTIVGMFDRYRAIAALGGVKGRFPLPWRRHLDFRITDRFALSSSVLPDHEGGEGGSRVFQVTQVERQYQEGVHQIAHREVPRGWLNAPAAFVESYSAGTVAFKTTGRFAHLWDTSPGQDFAAGWKVRIYDFSASPPYGASSTATVTAVGTNSIVIGVTTPPMTPAADDMVVLEDTPGDTGTENANQGADVEDFAFGADADLVLDDGRAGPTWG